MPGKFFLFLIKLGLPLIYFYHLVCSSIFLNFSASDDTGLEKWGNQLLTPVQYLLCAKKAHLNEEGKYSFEQRFDYTDHFYLKAASSFTALPFSLLVGGAAKALSYCCLEHRQHYSALKEAFFAGAVAVDLKKYEALGMQIHTNEPAEWTSPPKHKRREKDLIGFQEEINALKEIITVFNKYNIPFWLDCGTCLGTYRYGGTIPWDWDIDIAILQLEFDNALRALRELDPEKYAVEDWSSRERPNTYLKVYVKKANGLGLIDIYNFAIDPEKKQLAVILSNEPSIFLPLSWKIRERRYTKPLAFEHVFPLKKALFEGLEVFVPNQIETYLRTFYGENLEPARLYNEVTGEYEKDLSHPYWQLPYAH